MMQYRSNDRRHLEDLVFYCLELKEPVITMSKGRELLGFETMDEMRVWYAKKLLTIK